MKFYNLDAWQESRKLVVLVYEETAKFPKSETFGITNQMRRAAVSVAANIAEGFGRRSIKEKLNFYNQSNGSLTELLSHSILANDLGYLAKEPALKMSAHIESAQQILGGLVRSTKNRLHSPIS